MAKESQAIRLQETVARKKVLTCRQVSLLAAEDRFCHAPQCVLLVLCLLTCFADCHITCLYEHARDRNPGIWVEMSKLNGRL